MSQIGILAYGSVITDPGSELSNATETRILDVPTPFNVEFARSSRGRDGAPTIVPVETGGSPVNAVLLVLIPQVSPAEARSILWRRETGRIDPNEPYDPPNAPTPNTVLVDEYPNLCGVELVLTTRIGANICPLTARILAELAVASARGEAGMKRRDGISYLMDAKEAGIVTPLMEPYERELSELTGCGSLSEAWSHLTASVQPPNR